MTNILLKSGEDTNSAQEEFNAIKESSQKDKSKKKNNINMENSQNDSKKIYIVGVLCLLLGFAIGYLVFNGKSSSSDVVDIIDDQDQVDDESDTNGDVKDTSSTVVSIASISVNDQNFGDMVSVASVVLDRTGWIVVYEDNEGKPGSILGAGLYNEGTTSDGEVVLLRSTVPDSLYYVKIHADDGDRQFDFKKDVAVVGANGDEIVTTFTTGNGTPR